MVDSDSGEGRRKQQLRVRRRTDVSSPEPEAHSTVFCPGKGRSIHLAECAACQHVHRVAEHEIECSPPESSLANVLDEDPRLGGDVLTGETMGLKAVCARVETPAGVVARALEREGVLAAIIVDEWGRYVGLVDRPDVEAAPAHECLHGLVRVMAPVREGTALAPAIARMVQERARALPVVDEDRRPVGLVSDLDALRWVRQSRGSLRIP
jgi:CBS domain-containing protein